MLSWLREILKTYLQYLGAALCAIPAYFVFSALESTLNSQFAYLLSAAFAATLAFGVWKSVQWLFQETSRPTETANSLTTRFSVSNQFVTEAASPDFQIIVSTVLDMHLKRKESSRQIVSGVVFFEHEPQDNNTEASSSLRWTTTVGV